MFKLGGKKKINFHIWHHLLLRVFCKWVFTVPPFWMDRIIASKWRFRFLTPMGCLKSKINLQYKIFWKNGKKNHTFLFEKLLLLRCWQRKYLNQKKILSFILKQLHLGSHFNKKNLDQFILVVHRSNIINPPIDTTQKKFVKKTLAVKGLTEWSHQKMKMFFLALNDQN